MATSAIQPLLVGVDLVRISDVADSLRQFGSRFVSRLFTSDEERYCRAVPHMELVRFATRLAAKEATFKALRPGDDALPWRAVEVRRAAEGWCDIALHGRAAALARRRGIGSLALSMSHEGDYAMAVVVAGASPSRRRAS
jgi:holo-[acyl-carrier protein] synthase